MAPECFCVHVVEHIVQTAVLVYALEKTASECATLSLSTSSIVLIRGKITFDMDYYYDNISRNYFCIYAKIGSLCQKSHFSGGYVFKVFSPTNG